MKDKTGNIVELFAHCGALFEGHFVLSSGLHSDRYLQAARVLQYPWYAEACGKRIAAECIVWRPTVVVGPAMGGIIIAHAVGNALSVRTVFTERVEGKMTLRRGFTVSPDDRVLIVEDIVTTGGSAKEVGSYVQECGATVAGYAAIIDRSNGTAEFDAPLYTLGAVEVNTYTPEECPLCAEGIPIEKPGSRWLVNKE
jgi:orotate phosphoribosyltransferase